MLGGVLEAVQSVGTSLWGLVVSGVGIFVLVGYFVAKRVFGRAVDSATDAFGRWGRDSAIPVSRPFEWLIHGESVAHEDPDDGGSSKPDDAVTAHGFRWLDTSEFTDGEVDSEGCWRRTFTFAEVHEGYAIDRPPADADDPATADGSITEDLLAALRGGGSRVVTGPPGSGKTTAVRKLADRWATGGQSGEPVGRVLYRDRGSDRRIGDVRELAAAIRAVSDDEPVLVIVTDAARAPNLPALELVHEFRGDDRVSFLLDSREYEWDDLRGRAERNGVFDPRSDGGQAILRTATGIERYRLPKLRELETKRVIEEFERMTGTGRTVTGDPVLIHQRISMDGEASAMLLLSYHLPVGGVDVTAGDGSSSLAAHVRAVYDEVVPDGSVLAQSRTEKLRALVALGINVLSAAGEAVTVERLAGLAETDEERQEIRRLVTDEFRAKLVFGRDGEEFHANHELWSELYLVRHMEEADERDEPTEERTLETPFETVVNALASTVPADDRAGFLHTLFGIGRSRPKLAPLFARTGESGIDSVDTETKRWLAQSRGWIFDDFGAYDAAKSEYKFVANGTDSDQRKANALNNLGLVADSRGNYDEAEDYHQQSLDLKERLGDTVRKASSLNNLGLVARQRGNYAETEDYHQRSLDLAEQLGDTAGKATSLGNLGLVARKRGNYDKAEDYHQRSLDLKEQLGDTAGKAKSLGNLGGVAYRRGNYDKAEDYYQRSLDLAEQLGDTAGKATSLGNLGLVADSRGNYAEAEDYHQRSLDLEEQLGNTAGKASSLINLGRVAYRRGNYAEAEDYASRAASLFAEIGAVRQFLKADRNAIHSALELDDTETAVERAHHALQVIDNSDLGGLDEEREFREQVIAEHAEQPAD